MGLYFADHAAKHAILVRFNIPQEKFMFIEYYLEKFRIFARIEMG